MSRVFHVYAKPLERLNLSLFEKVILANSLMLICEALVGLWVTSHNLEAHHYLIDTSFIVFATLLGLLMNVALIRNQSKLSPIIRTYAHYPKSERWGYAYSCSSCFHGY